MALDKTAATFSGTEVELDLGLKQVSGGVEVALGHVQSNYRDPEVRLEWSVFVNGDRVASPTPFNTLDVRGEDRTPSPVDAEPGDVIDVVVTDGSTEASVSGTVPGDSGGGDDEPVAEPPEEGTIEVTGCDAPDTVDVGETAYVFVAVENTGGEQASATVLTSAGGASDETQVALPAGGTQTVVSGFEFDEGGDYAVDAQVV